MTNTSDERLLRIAKEINHALAWPYALALGLSMACAALGWWASGFVTMPWVGRPLLAFASWVAGLLMIRTIVLHPWLRAIERHRMRPSVEADDDLTTLRAIADEHELTLLAAALARLETR